MKSKENPKDWKNTSVIFAKALSYALSENEGVVIDLEDDLFFEMDSEVKKVIVYSKEDQIYICACPKDLDEGSIVLVHNYNPN